MFDLLSVLNIFITDKYLPIGLRFMFFQLSVFFYKSTLFLEPFIKQICVQTTTEYMPECLVLFPSVIFYFIIFIIIHFIYKFFQKKYDKNSN